MAHQYKYLTEEETLFMAMHKEEFMSEFNEKELRTAKGTFGADAERSLSVRSVRIEIPIRRETELSTKEVGKNAPKKC